MASSTQSIIGVILVIAVITGSLLFTSFGDPLKDAFAQDVERETVIEYLTEYVWVNDTIWINSTEYIPYWINSTVWYNETIWINSTEYLPYPFVDGWNISGTEYYMKALRSGAGQYRIIYYDQIAMADDSTTYSTFQNTKTALYVRLADGRISQQQFDAGFLQLMILSAT